MLSRNIRRFINNVVVEYICRWDNLEEKWWWWHSNLFVYIFMMNTLYLHRRKRHTVSKRKYRYYHKNDFWGAPHLCERKPLLEYHVPSHHHHNHTILHTCLLYILRLWVQNVTWNESMSVEGRSLFVRVRDVGEERVGGSYQSSSEKVSQRWGIMSRSHDNSYVFEWLSLIHISEPTRPY